LRFDDMLATVLAQPDADRSARAAKWRQLVDLLAQPRAHSASDRLEEALTFLRAHREEIPSQIRREIAQSLGGRRTSPLLLRFFGEDSPAIAAPVIGTAQLPAEEWLELLPSMGPTARALLRHRRDLHPEVEQALAAFGSSDFVLSGGVPDSGSGHDGAGSFNPAPEGGEAQIRELVARIEAFKRGQRMPDRERPEVQELPLVENFRWETGPDGVIIWVEGTPRGPLIGQTIASFAGPTGFGVDGQAAGAFEKRAPFRDARLRIAGSGSVAGDWRISGVPFFEPRRGSFLGYRGSARRPRLDEVAAPANSAKTGGLFGTNVPADSLRQLIHELRTPLNAILGFAEMIDGQYMGPAALGYRSRAKEIIEQAGRLLSAVDDLDTAARIETDRLTLEDSNVDAGALLSTLRDAYAHIAGQRNAAISVTVAENLPEARVEPALAERMFARLLAATIGLAEEGETISATMAMGESAAGKLLCLSIDRPRAILGKEEAALLDPGYSPDGDWPGAPSLGLGFALRLVRNLADAVGGMLVVGEERFFLYLPAVDHAEQPSEQSV
jgi:signal transduction histidine kinase